MDETKMSGPETVVTVKMAGMETQTIPVVPTRTKAGKVVFTTQSGANAAVNAELPAAMFEETEESTVAASTGVAGPKAVYGIFIKGDYLKTLTKSDTTLWQIFGTWEEAQQMNRICNMTLRSMFVSFDQTHIVDSLNPSVALDIVEGNTFRDTGRTAASTESVPALQCDHLLASEAQAAAENLRSLFRPSATV